MIVCSCNVITDHAIRDALADAAASPRAVGQVYRCLGCSPACGRCARTILAILREAGVTPCGGCVSAEIEVARIEAGDATVLEAVILVEEEIRYAIAAE